MTPLSGAVAGGGGDRSEREVIAETDRKIWQTVGNDGTQSQGAKAHRRKASPAADLKKANCRKQQDAKLRG